MSDFIIEVQETRGGRTVKALYFPHTENKKVEIHLQVPGKWLELGVGTWENNKIQGITAVLPDGLLDALAAALLSKIPTE